MIGAGLILPVLFAAGLPVFKGYEAPRYQQHDELILRLVAEFNAEQEEWTGATEGQKRSVVPLDPVLVKAHMIEETGGNDPLSRAAWAVDPLQVNVPGDWNRYKSYVGLKKPRHRNEGTREKNIRAGISYLARKGFGRSGQPAANRPDSRFDGWRMALERYNGRTVITKDGKPYCTIYAEKIERRKKKPETHVPVQIPVSVTP